MAELPDPLTPPDCDLRDFKFMPLDIVRLFGSRFHAVANDSEWRAGVTLWAKSFHQVPAASVPDDEVELCRLAELGRDLKAWRKLAKNAMHGWVKCSDGRFYHPIVAEKANDAWTSKLLQRFKTECARLKKHCQRQGVEYVEANFEQWVEAGCPQGQMQFVPRTNPDCPEDKRELSQGRPKDNSGTHSSKGQGQGQGQGIKERAKPPEREPERDASTRIVNPPNPCPADPVEAWAHFADRIEVSTSQRNPGRPVIVVPGHPETYLDILAADICQAAELPRTFRGPWDFPIAWLRAGIHQEQIVAAITRVAKRTGYNPPSTLKYFDKAVRGEP